MRNYAIFVRLCGNIQNMQKKSHNRTIFHRVLHIAVSRHTLEKLYESQHHICSLRHAAFIDEDCHGPEK